MQDTGYLVDWPQVVKRWNAGTLEDTFSEALENGEAWIEALDFYTDSHQLYLAMIQAYEELHEGLPATVRKRADQFMNPLITYDGYCMDLGDEGEMFALSISPESAAKFARLGAGINFNSFKKPFEDDCSDDTKDILGGDDPDNAFEENFLPYIEMWLSALQRAAQEKKGILISWG
jgi:hypothetical protein